MLTEFFKKLEKSKWLPWVVTAPLILIPLALMFGGELSRGVGLFTFFASMWVGIILGSKLALLVSTRIFKASEDLAERLDAAFGAFGFLFLPVLVGLLTNANLGTEIAMHSLSAHFLWACVGAGIFFVTPRSS